MMKAPHVTSTEPAWEPVSSQLPCPICGAERGCSMHTDEAFVLCSQVRSEWPLTTGGWLHKDRSTAPDAPTPDVSGVYAAFDARRSRPANVYSLFGRIR